MSQTTGHASFVAAAQLLGHDTDTVTGVEDARHDHRVHDLLDEIDDVVLEASSYSSAYRRANPNVQADIAAARAAIRNSSAVSL